MTGGPGSIGDGDEDTALTEQVIYDEAGNRILKYTSIQTLDTSTLETPWTWGETSVLYVYAFSTSEDLAESYWDLNEGGFPTDPANVWKQLLKIETSDVSY